MSSSGRNEETNRPNVGSVHRIAMRIATAEPIRDVSDFFASDASERRCSGLPLRSYGPAGPGVTTVLVVIARSWPR